MSPIENQIPAILETAKQFRVRYWTRAPELWANPSDADRGEFRSMAREHASGWWNQLLATGTEKDMQTIYEKLEQNQQLTSTIVMLSILEALWSKDNNTEEVSQNVIQWFRTAGFKGPLFSFEETVRPVSPPTPKLVVEAPLTLRDYILMEDEIASMRARLSISDTSSVKRLSAEIEAKEAAIAAARARELGL